MSLPISSQRLARRWPGGLCLLLAACAGQEEHQLAGTPIECAVAGAAAFTADCTMEIVERNGERSLVVRHADGGFRRFALGVPASGIITADGFESASVSPFAGGVEVSVGADRYRLAVLE